MGWVRRDWTWNKADLGSYLPTSSLDRQLLHIYLVPDSAVNTQRFALSLFSFSQSTVQVSNLQARIGTSCQINGSIRLDIKCTINAICLNHSETISPLLVLGKTVFHEIGESATLITSANFGNPEVVTGVEKVNPRQFPRKKVLGNSDRLHSFQLHNRCRWWLQPWN